MEKCIITYLLDWERKTLSELCPFCHTDTQGDLCHHNFMNSLN